MATRPFRKLALDRVLVSASLALGIVHAWAGRYAMNPDGMSYLDVGDAFFRRDWPSAINAYWSPLYPWTIGLVIGIVKPAPQWEFPLAHLVNFGIFAAALFAFRFLLHTLLSHAREQSTETLPEWALSLVAYPIFLWIALEVETLYDLSPDLAVLACLCLAAGLLLRLRPGAAVWKFALFGLILGIGYWVKAILFPLGFVSLAVAYLWKRSMPGWRRAIAVAVVAFLLTTSPLVLLLSHQKGRFTFGDSGRLNYAWLVYPRAPIKHWQGHEADGGVPAHPTRQLLFHPPLFQFDGPVVGTYPPWTDPSYWNEGLQAHFKLRPELQVVAVSLLSEVRLLFRERPELAAGTVILALMSGSLWLAAVRELWPLIAVSFAGMGIYVPVLENDRYLGGFVLILFLVLLSATRVPLDSVRNGIYVAVAVAVVMALGTADYTARVLMHHMAIPGNGPNSTTEDLLAAKKLLQMGLKPGAKVAVIGDGTGAYWARLAKLRIVAEIPGMNHGPREFWNSSEELRQQAYQLFRESHARVVVADCPGDPPSVPEKWEQMPATSYCMHWLE